MTGLLTVDEARVKRLDFTVPLFVERIYVTVKRPVLERDMAGFVKPLTIPVRVCLLVYLFVRVAFGLLCDVMNLGLSVLLCVWLSVCT